MLSARATWESRSSIRVIDRSWAHRPEEARHWSSSMYPYPTLQLLGVGPPSFLPVPPSAAFQPHALPADHSPDWEGTVVMVARSPRSPALCWRIDPLSSCTTETGVFAERPAGRSSSHRSDIRWSGYHLGFRRQKARGRASGRVRECAVSRGTGRQSCGRRQSQGGRGRRNRKVSSIT